MPILQNREYRNAEAFRASEVEEYIVEGYASTFEPYAMATDDKGNVYSERISPEAFASADMRDVIMQYNHEGKVYARQSNGTLEVSTDDHGLRIRADLSKSAGARELYEEIRAGLINQMSFAFTVEPGGDHYEKETRTRVIDRVKKVFDVSAVSIPANPGTEISARSYFDGVIKEEAEEVRKAEENDRKRRYLTLLLEVEK